MRARVALAMALVLMLAACAPSAEVDPLDSGRQHVEASACAGVNRYQEAIADLQTALVEDPSRVEAHYWLYLAYARSGQAALAASTLSNLAAAVAAGQGGAEARFWLFQIYGQAGDEAGQAEMLTALQEETRANPARADAHFWLGRAYYEAGDSEQAQASFESAVAMDAGHVMAHFWLGQLYTEQGQLDAAREEFDTVLRLDPQNAAALHNRGVILYQLGEMEAARRDFEAAIEQEPDDPRSHYQLGVVHLAAAVPDSPLALPDEEKLNQASAEFEEALELCPGMFEPLIGLGNVYLVRGDAAAALEVLNQAADQNPNSPEVWFALLQLYATTQQVEPACQAYARFVSLSPPQEWMEAADQIRVTLGCP
jgi:protein O-GlcNAc transferase